MQDGVTYIKLKGYNRFSLSGKKDFELEITDPILAIIGTNGSGKSSLLSQLNEWPVDASQFQKDGYKELHRWRGGKKYITKVMFSPQVRYYFEVDGEVLNNWGTASVQKTLIEQHLKLTQDSLDFILSRDRMSQLSPAARKDWFVRLDGASYDYAIALYSRAREKLRDIQGAIKLAKARHVIEVEKKVSDDKIEQARLEVQLYEKTLEELYRIKPSPGDNLTSLESQREYLTTRIISSLASVRSIKAQIKLDHSEEVTTQLLSALSAIIKKTQFDLSQASTEYDKLCAQKAQLEQAAAHDQEKLRLEVEQLIEKRAQLRQETIEINTQGRARDMLTQLDELTSELVDISGHIPDNTQALYSSERLQEKRDEFQQLKLRIENITQKRASVQGKLNHMLEHKDKRDAQCPSCNHNFSLNYSAVKEVAWSNEIVEYTKIIDELTEKQKACGEYLTQCEEYGFYWRKWVSIQRTTPALENIWNYFNDESVFSSSPKSKTHHISTARSYLEKHVQLDAIEARLNEITALRRKLILTDRSVSLSSVTDRLTKVAATVGQITARLDKYRKRQLLLQSHLSMVMQINRLESVMEDYCVKAKSNLTALIHHEYVTAYNKIISFAQDRVSQIRQAYHAAVNQENIIQALVKNIDEMKLDEQAYQHIVDELSPKDGIIAEGLYGFIESFIGQVNTVIERVWTYKLKVHASKKSTVDNVELDYKFPVEIIKVERNVTDDISHTSKGQCEMIDIAFLIVAMIYMGMRDIPLILDEIGSSFDVEHKQNLIILLKEMIEERTFSQIFMVSHDYSQYCAMNSQMVVLDESNVRLRK